MFEAHESPPLKKQVHAVSHFLKLNGLHTLRFNMSKAEFEKHMSSRDQLVPIVIRDYGHSSTTVFIKYYKYDYSTETLTVEAKEVLKYI